MKKHLLSMLLATIWLCGLAQIPTSGLIQRFTFDGTLNGINGNTLSLFGQPNYVNDRFSNANSAQNLTTTSNSFNTASLTNLPTGNADRTVCFWYKSNANATHSLFNYGNSGANTFAIAYTTGPTRLVLFNGATEYSRNITYTGNWTHVAVVHSAGNSYIYLNGVQQGAALAVSYATTAGQTVNIGFSPGGTPYANFQMDELLVYNRALTSGEVVDVYNACGNPVNTTTAANQSICTGSTATLSVAGSNVSWYANPSGGSPIAAGNSFTTGVLTANTSYYAESAGCVVRTEVPVTVKQAAPSAPGNITSAGLLTRCAGDVSTLSVSGADSIRWYSVATGGTAIGTGNSFTTPALANPFPNATGTVTYYAEAWNACGASARTPITVTIKATPATPVSTTPSSSLNICTGSSTTLTVSSTSGTVEWSTVSVTPSVVGTGNSFTTPTLTTTTQYAVYAVLNGCFSTDQTLTVNVSQSGAAAPANNTAPAALSVCEGSTTSLTASSSGNTLYWYDAPTGGNLLGTGSPFVTPAINDTTIFYVQAGTGSCASARTAITVTTKFVPTGVIQLINDTIRATNLYNSYVLRKDTTIIASSNTTGSFAIPATQCGDYQATFTNPTNNCPNINVSVSKAYLSNEFYCEGRVTLTGVTFPVTYSMNYSPSNALPTTIDNAAPLNFPLTSNLTSCSAVSGMRYIRFKTGAGCIYDFSFNAELQFGTFNTTAVSTTDSVTTCSFTSNTLTVSTVNLPAPANTTAAPWLSICSGLSTTLSASGSGTLYWYDVPTGGTALGTGTSFNTPALTANKTYYVQAGTGTCASARTAITVNVNALPPAPVNVTPTANQNICSGSSTVLSVTPPAAGITTFWSMFPQGGNSFAVGNSTTIPASSLTATDTFYVGHAYTANNCNSPLIPIVVNVTQAPAAPVNTTPTANQTVCVGATTVLTATGTGTLEWFANPTGGNALSTGGSFTTPAINTATSYFVASNGGNGCSSTRTEVQVLTAPVPPAPSNTTAIANLTRCAGNTTTLTASSNFANAPLKWYANATGGASLATGGSYTTPVLTATDTFYVAAETASCPSQRTAIVVTVNPVPVASISPATLAVCSGATATLTASGGGTYTWSSSGGTNAAATFSPTTNTTYTVTVTAAGCSATATGSVTVNAVPAAAIAPATLSICSGQSAQLTASGGTQYAWSNAGGSNAVANFSPVATTAYTVTVTNANNCSATATRTVTVNNISASINGPTTICSGLQATLTASGGTGYAWSNSLGNSAAITVSPTANTTYTVTVTGAGNCTATASQTVSVQNAPTAVITGNTTICSGESATLTANGGNTYTWSSGLGTNAAITVSPTANTTYTVTVSIGANCTATATETVIVNQPSASSFSQIVCNGESFSFGGNTLTAGGVYYDTLQNVTGCDSIVTLNFSVLPLATATINATICTNQSYEFDGMQLTQDGQYFDTLQTQEGCDSFVVLNLSVVSQLTSSFSAAICQGESYNFNGQVLTSADSYTETFTSIGGCDSVVTLTLTVNALPEPVISANNNVLSTQGFDTYQWQLEGSDINGANGQQYTATQNGNYTVWVSDANGCEAVSAIYNVTGIGIMDIATANIRLYPNPAENVLVVEVPAIDFTKLTVTDMEGRVLMEQYISGKQQLDISSLPAGILSMQFNSSTGMATTKLVKLK